MLAFLVSVANNFWWNRHWTFETRATGTPASRRRASSPSASSRSCSAYGVLVLLVEAAGLPKVLAQAIAIVRRDAAVVPRAEALELPQMSRAAARIAAAVLLLAALVASSAAAAQLPAPTRRAVRQRAARGAREHGATTATDPNALTTPPSPSIPPPNHRLTSKRAIAIAERVPKIARVRREHRGSYPTAYTKGAAQWQVSIFAAETGAEIGQVTIDDATGAVLEAWTGYQVAVDDGARLRRRVRADASTRWYVWIPMCVLFLAPFLPTRRAAAVRRGCTSTCSCCSASPSRWRSSTHARHRPLDAADLSAARLPAGAHAARRAPRRRAREPLRLLVPVSWLAVGLVFLIGFRVGLNVTNSNVIDVGYSGVIGANRLVHGQPLYGRLAEGRRARRHVRARQLLRLRAVRADLAVEREVGRPAGRACRRGRLRPADDRRRCSCSAGRIRGPSLGIVLAYAWAAFPFTLYASSTNSNDALVALLLVVTLLLAGSAGRARRERRARRL